MSNRLARGERGSLPAGAVPVRARTGERDAAGAGSLGSVKEFWQTLASFRKGKGSKLAMLLRERLMFLRGAFGSRAGTAARPAAAADDASAPGARDDERHWDFRSELHLPPALLDLATLSREDRREAPGLLVTEHRHTVARLHEARAYTNEHSWRSVYDREGHLRPVLSSIRNGEPPNARHLPAPARRIEGRTASAYGNTAMAGGNYGHWLIDGVAMLLSIEREHSLAEFDHVLVPHRKYDFHHDSLALFGFGPESVIELPALEVLEFEELTCASRPRGDHSAVIPGWVVDGYRDRLFDGRTPAHRDRLVYVSRRDAATRNFVNEDEMCDMLEAKGFETVKLADFDLAGKARLFSEARCLIGASGAGMTNAMFCSPGATLLEVYSPTFMHYSNASICAHLGIGYDWLMARDTSLISRVNKYYGDLYLDVDALERKLSELDIA